MKEKEPGIILLTKEACKAQWWVEETGNNEEIVKFILVRINMGMVGDAIKLIKSRSKREQ